MIFHPTSLSHLQLESKMPPIQRTAHPQPRLLHDVRVNQRGGHILVPEQILQGPAIGDGTHGRICPSSWHPPSRHHLRRIETVMQRLELSLLAKLPSNQRSLITEGQPMILEIAVTEMDSEEKRADRKSN